MVAKKNVRELIFKIQEFFFQAIDEFDSLIPVQIFSLDKNANKNEIVCSLGESDVV